MDSLANSILNSILKEKEDLDTQVKNLAPYLATILNERKISVSFELYMTLLDGKVLNVLTGTKSCELCYICGAGPKQFMENTDINSFKPKSGHLCYGLSPLHAWIRVFKLLLKISYRKGFQNAKQEVKVKNKR